MAAPFSQSVGTAYAYNTSNATVSNPNPFPTGQAQFQFWGSPVYKANTGEYWAPGFEGATFATNFYDYIKLGVTYGPPTGGVAANRTPGICHVRVEKGYEVDAKKAVGSHGARATFHGRHAAGVKSKGEKMRFDIDIEIWTPEQLRQLWTMYAYLIPQVGGDVAPLGVDAQHPTLAGHGIKAIQLVSCEGPTISADRRGIFRFKALEFQKPSTTTAVSTPVATLSNAYDPPTPALPGANGVDTGPR